MTCIPTPACLLTKACLLRAPSVVTSTQASVLHDEGGPVRPHNSELRTHRRLEHPRSTNHNNTGRPASTTVHSSHKIDVSFTSQDIWKQHLK